MQLRDDSREGERAKACTTKKALLTLGVAGAIGLLSPETVYAADPVTVDGATVTTITSSNEQTSLQSQLPQDQSQQSSTGTLEQTTSSPSDSPSDTTSLIQGDVAVLRPEDNYNIGGEQSEPGTEPNPEPTPVPQLANASSEVIQPASESVTTQVTIDAAATAVATAASELQQTSTTLQEVSSQSNSLSTPSSSITDTVAAAQDSTSAASTAVAVAQTAIANAQSLQDTASASQSTATLAQETLNGATEQLTTATTVLTQRTEEVSQQTTIVAEASTAVNTAQSTLDSATAAVDAQEVVVTNAVTDLDTAKTNLANASTPTTTVIENFQDGRAEITVTVGDQPVIGAVQNAQGSYIPSGYNMPPLVDKVLFTNGSNNLTINPTQDNVTSIIFDIYAKNGNAAETIHYTDGTTGTGVLENNVMVWNNQSNPTHTSTEIIAAPTGKYIDKVVIAADYDIYLIDNVRITQPGTAADPSLATAVTTAQQTLVTETNTLNTLIATETTAAQNLDNAETTLATEQATLTTLTTQQAEAQTTVTTLTNTVAVATQVNDQAQAQATTDQTAATTAANALPALITAATTAIDNAQHDVAVAGAVTAVAVAQDLVTQWNSASQAAGDAGVASNLQVIQALNTAAETINTAIADAQVALTDVTTAQVDQADADSDAELLATAQQDLTDAQSNFDAAQELANALTVQVPLQEQVVATAQQNLADAQAAVDTNTTGGLSVKVYSVAGQNNAPTVPAGATPIHTYTDTNGISEYWGGGNVAGSTRSEDVVVEYTGQLTFDHTGTTWFTASADDGARVWFDGVQVLNDWFDKGGGGSTITYQTTAGQTVDFKLTYYENGGGAVIDFMQYTDNGWVSVPGSAFSTSTATPAQVAALAAAQSSFITESAELTTLQSQLESAQATTNVYADELATTTTNVDMYENEVTNSTLASTTSWATAESSSTTATNSVASAEQSIANVLSVIQQQDAATPPVTVDYSANEGGVIEIAAPQGQIITGISGWYASAFDADEGAVVDPSAFTNFIGGNVATISADNGTLLGDPLPGTPKVLYVDVTYETAYIAPILDVVVTQLSDGNVQVTWTAPTGSNIDVERYAVSWSTSSAGWGVATGNAGDANALNTTIVLPASLFESTGGLDTSYNFSVRADNDSLAVYSSTYQTDPVLVVDPTPTPPPAPPVDPTPQPPIPDPEPVTPEEPPLPVDPPVTPEPEVPVEPEPEIPVEPEPEIPVEPEPEVPVDPVTPEEPVDPTPVDPEPETPVDPEPVVPVDPSPEDNNTPTPAEVKAEVTDALSDGKVSTAELNDIGDAMAADGKVDAKETTQIVDALSADGKVTAAEAASVLDILAGDGDVSKEDVAALVAMVGDDGKLSEADKAVVADALIEQFSGEGGVDVNAVAEAGIDLADLPPETPIELNNGVVITAEVGNAFETLADPGELVGAIFSDPGQVATALANLGADMSEEEREESQEAVVAAVIAGGAAIQAAAGAAAAAAGSAGGGAPSGGSHGGGGSSPRGGGDAGAPIGKEGGSRPRKTPKTKAKIKSPRPRRTK